MRNTEDIIKLKEMIIAGIIDIKSLSKAELDVLIDKEYETMDEYTISNKLNRLKAQYTMLRIFWQRHNDLPVKIRLVMVESLFCVSVECFLNIMKRLRREISEAFRICD